MLARCCFLVLYVALGALTHRAYAQSESRLALLIGNAAYRSSPLANPVNDVRLMQEALTDAGFTVVKAENASIRDMRRLIRDFGDRLKSSGGVGLFYFAGHGVQVRGENFLVSTDSDIRNEDEVPDDSVNASVILEKMQGAGNRMNIIILDACRNNPFAVKSRSAQPGLATMSAPSGSLVAYATAPGSVASDGAGRNGLYTEHLARVIRQPGLPIEEVFKQVRAGVRRDSNNQQTPWENTALEGQFFFRGVTPAVATTVPSPSTRVPDQGDPVAVELAFWDSVKNSRSSVELRAYLSQYPNGRFASLAKARLDGLTAAPSNPAVVAVAPAAPVSASPTQSQAVTGVIGTLVTIDPYTKIRRSVDVSVVESSNLRTSYSTGDVVDKDGRVVQALIGDIVMRPTSGTLWTLPVKPGTKGSATIERVAGPSPVAGTLNWKASDIGNGKVQVEAEVQYLDRSWNYPVFGKWQAVYTGSNHLPDSFSTLIRAATNPERNNVVTAEFLRRSP